MVLTRFFRLFVNCSGLMKSYNLERNEMVLSFLNFKEIRSLVFLVYSNFENLNASDQLMDFPILTKKLHH